LKVQRIVFIFVVLSLILTALGPLVPNASAWLVLSYTTCRGYDPTTYACVGPSNNFTTLDGEVWIHAEFDFRDIPKNVKFNSTSEWRDPTGNLYQRESYLWSGGSSRWISNRGLKLISIVNDPYSQGTMITDIVWPGIWTVSYILDGGPFGHNLKAFTAEFTVHRTEVAVPIATAIPDPDNPFAPGTWDDAFKVPLDNYVEIAQMEIPSKPDYLYAKYTPYGSNPRLFLYSDSTFAIYNETSFFFGYLFDTMDDGWANWNKNPDDFYFGRQTDPSLPPPKFSKVFDSKFATKLEQDGGFIFRWTFGKSENSNQDHYMGYAEIPIRELLKYPNPNDPSRMAFNADDEQILAVHHYPSGDQVTKGIVVSLGEFSQISAHWSELVLTNTSVVTSTTLSTSTLVLHTENTGSTMTTQPITLPVNLENKPTGVSTNLILLGLVIAAMIVGSVVYVRRKHKVRHGDGP